MPLVGKNDWTYRTLEFNSGISTEVTIAARLGYDADMATGTAWFDDIRLEALRQELVVITASAGANGTINPSGAVTVPLSSHQTFTITPEFGYHLSELLINGTPVTPVLSYTFTGVTENQTIEARFAPNVYSGVPVEGVREDLWVTNGMVYSVAQEGNIIYIGGYFTQVAPAAGSGVVLSQSTASIDPAFPKVNGPVYAVAPDGGGGWYIGGDFTLLGGIQRNNIAHITASGQVSSWNPNANHIVRALAVSGSVVYAGGFFTSIGGQTRNRIAAIDAATGVATAWNPSANDGIQALAISGNTIYAGGRFTSIGGQTRNRIAAIDASTGTATAWNPNANGEVHALVAFGPVIYVGGSFTSLGGESRNRIAAIDISTGAATAWNPNANSTIQALAVSGNTIYAGGFFTSIGGQARNYIAALDAATGMATGWNPSANNWVTAIALSNSTIYAGGSFTSIGGQARNYIAVVDATTGATRLWNPKLNQSINNSVYALAVAGSMVYAGGNFTSAGGETRNNIAALDASTGTPTSWNPNLNNGVHTLAVSGSTIYAGGAFTAVGNQTRNRIAAIDASTGLATAWNPNANSSLFDLAVSGSTVYAGGAFTSIGGQARNYIAALDAATGMATGWNPSANNWVTAIALSNSTIYAGGSFTSIGGQARNRLAALDATTGTATAWNPDANNRVLTLAISGSTIYAGGEFTSIGGQARNRIAAIDGATGAATAWNPNVNNIVWKLALSGPAVYTAGDFTSIGGQTRNYLAAIDAATGVVSTWNRNLGPSAIPGLSTSMRALAISGSTIYGGGAFRAGAQVNIAALYDPDLDRPTTWTITASAGANGTIDPSGAVSVLSGAGQSFTITPSNGYYISDVLVDGQSVGAVSSYVFTNVTSNHTIEAVFAVNTYSITAHVSDGSNAISGATLMLEGTSSVTTDATGTHTFSGLSAGASYTVSVSAEGMSFIPSKITFSSLLKNETVTFTRAKGNNTGAGEVTLLASETIDAEGGTIQLQDGITLVVPQDNTEPLRDPTTFQVGIIDPPPSGVKFPGPVFYFSPSGSEFDPALQLTVKYAPDNELAEQGIAESDLRIIRYDEASGKYKVIQPYNQDTGDNTLTASVTHFSLYGAGILLPPELGEISAVDPVALGSAVTLSAGFTDPGAPNTQTAIWSWGDGTTSTCPDASTTPSCTLSKTNGSGTVTGTHTYADVGVYTVTLTLTDVETDASAQSTYRYVVIYDPNAGFVTGGGWIDSPAGAYTPDPALTGKASFGFVSRYKKGAKVPEGQTNFSFHVASFHFQSTAYEWLVISGPKAQYKGSGTVNGSGSYGFILTANDGQISGGGGTDKFRLKVWEKAGGTIVYDNQMGNADDAAASDAIEGGSIVIHTGGKTNASVVAEAVGVEASELAELPEEYGLEQNYPNPFNPETVIRFALPEASHVVVKVYNMLGQEVATLANEDLAAGHYNLRWEARDLSGAPLPSGTYIYRIQAGRFTQSKVMTLLR